MDTASPHRLLDARVFVGLVLLTIIGIEGVTRAGYHTRDGLREKAGRFEAAARDEDKNLVILGTCLPEQHILEGLLQDRLGSGWVVHNLGNQATSPLDWYLAFAHELPLDRVDGVLIAHGRRDLVAQISAWESRVTEVATWGDMPGLIEHVCDDADCKSDMLLRKASATWRYRVRIANRWWAALDALAVEAPSMPPPPTDEDLQAPLYYLGELLRTAQEAEVPVWFVPLPYREAAGGTETGQDMNRYHGFVDPVITAGGATVLDIPSLPEEDFVDDSHVTKEGATLLTTSIAAALRAALSLPEPPETPPETPAGPVAGGGGPAAAPIPGVGSVAGAPPSGTPGAPAPGTAGPATPAGPAPGTTAPATPGAPAPGTEGPSTPLAPPPGAGGTPSGRKEPDPASASPTYIPPPSTPQGPPLPNTPP